MLGPAHTRPIFRGDPIAMVGDRSLEYVDRPRSPLVVIVTGPKAPHGLMVTVRIRSWRPSCLVGVVVGDTLDRDTATVAMAMLGTSSAC